MKFFGFTLAEILITLGIIGIVAAMTIPALITKHKRHVAEVKLQKFYSVINNAMKMIEENYGEISEVTTNNKDTSYFSKEFYEKYFTPYMSNVIIRPPKKDYYVNSENHIVFADGSGFRVRNYHTALNFLYYIDVDKANAKDKKQYEFYFEYNPTRHVVAPYGIYWANGKDLTSTSLYESQKADCYDGSYTYYCAAIIQQNGWKIPKDYPHIK